MKNNNMKTEEALKNIETLINAGLKGGMFANIQDVQIAIESLDVLKKSTTPLSDAVKRS